MKIKNLQSESKRAPATNSSNFPFLSQSLDTNVSTNEPVVKTTNEKGLSYCSTYYK